ncbi:ester cyclase [Cystobacter fuscus]|uniref:ester cyclase n=1 Tax=Cystobacter fuscus TaxID=43 RepID=UPI0006870730|nr:ester cyclase [Cystobacter fuscus]
MKREKDVAPPQVTGLTATEQRSIETLYRAFNEKNPDLLDEAVTTDWKDIPLAPGQGPGPDGLKPIIRGFIAAFPDLQITLQEIIGAPGRAGVRALITGTHQGEWFGIAPTGKAIHVPLHEFHHLENGRITHTWHLEDWFGMLNQVGAWPAHAIPSSEAAS